MEVGANHFAINKAATTIKIAVINISFELKGDSESLKKSLKKAYDEGIVIVAPAGNDAAKNIVFPAAYKFIFAVGGIGPDKKLYSQSNHGPGLDFVAPAAGLYTPNNKNGYGWVRGTSFAGAYISGTAALIIQAYRAKHKREPKPGQVFRILRKISVKLDGVDGSGLPDASKIEEAV